MNNRIKSCASLRRVLTPADDPNCTPTVRNLPRLKFDNMQCTLRARLLPSIGSGVNSSHSICASLPVIASSQIDDEYIELELRYLFRLGQTTVHFRFFNFSSRQLVLSSNSQRLTSSSPEHNDVRKSFQRRNRSSTTPSIERPEKFAF